MNFSLTITNVQEKRWFFRFMHINIYVNDYWRIRPGFAAYNRLYNAGDMPASMADRYPLFAEAYKKFLTSGRWPSMIQKWNPITPLPLPG